jgi:hypothetical protein
MKCWWHLHILCGSRTRPQALEIADGFESDDTRASARPPLQPQPQQFQGATADYAWNMRREKNRSANKGDDDLPAGDVKMLFIDDTVLSHKSRDLRLVVNRPTKVSQPVIVVDKPWELWGLDLYSTVIRDPAENDGSPRAWRLYYESIVSASYRRFMCVAFSADGLRWTKPALGLVSFNGSSETNIVYPTSENYKGGYQVGNVFVDDKPGTPAAQRWKHITQRSCQDPPGNGLAVLWSADGLRWNDLHCASTGVTGSDTFNIAFFDTSLSRPNSNGSYVGYIRIDNELPNPHAGVVCGSQPAIRRVGRCEFDNVLGSWGKDCNNHNASVAFSFDAEDPPCLDYYTSAITKLDDGIYLGFPSAFSHTTFGYGDGNDGLVDVRLIVSRDGVTFRFVDAIDGRAPWIPLGLNTCDQLVPADADPAGMQWCAKTATLEGTAADGAALYMTQGVLPSHGKVSVFYGAEAMTHGGYQDIEPVSAAQRVFRRQAIFRAEIRENGWVSLDAAYSFGGGVGPSSLPNFTTIGLIVPEAHGCPALRHANRSVVPPPKPHHKVTHCSYSMPDGRCGGRYPVLQTCAKDADCGGTVCNASMGGCCDGIAIHCSKSVCCGSVGCVCGQRTSEPNGTIITGGLNLQVNIQTSVVGLLFLELQVLSETGVEWRPAPGFSLDESDPIRGNFLAKAASWRRGTADLSSLAGKKVRVHAAMVDAKLFSFVFGCASNTTNSSHNRHIQYKSEDVPLLSIPLEACSMGHRTQHVRHIPVKHDMQSYRGVVAAIAIMTGSVDTVNCLNAVDSLLTPALKIDDSALSTLLQPAAGVGVPHSRARGPAQLYVDCTNGSDRVGSYRGTRAAPLRSLAAALHRAAAEKTAGTWPTDRPYIIALRRGECQLASPLLIGPNVSGTSAASPLVIRGDGPGSILSGGRPIDGPWSAVEWPGAPAGSVIAASVQGLGLEEIKLLRVGAAMANRSRWPKTVGSGQSTANWLFATSSAGQPDGSKLALRTLGLDPEALPAGTVTNLSSLIGAWASVYGCAEDDVNSQKQKIVSVDSTDPAHPKVSFQFWGGFNPGVRVNLENVPWLREGEFYHDEKVGRLIFWPTAAMAASMQHDGVFPTAANGGMNIALNVSNASHVVISNLSFTDLTYHSEGWRELRDGAIKINFATGIHIEACNFVPSVGAFAVSIGNGSVHCSVVGCLVDGIGQGGVLMYGEDRIPPPPVPPPPPGACVAKKVDCHPIPGGQARCLAIGCCWVPANPGPYCFHKNNTPHGPAPPPPPPRPVSEWFVGLQPRHIDVAHCSFHDFGRETLARGAVFMEAASSCLISHNRIDGCPRYGMSSNTAYGNINSRNNVFEYNLLSNTNRLSTDTGAFEALGSGNPNDAPVPWNTNTTFRFNNITATWGCSIARDKQVSVHGDKPGGRGLVWGVYLDGGQAGFTIHGNIIGGSLDGSVFDNAGGNNVQTNNVFVGEPISQHLLQIGADPRKNKPNPPRSVFGNVVRSNIFVARSNATQMIGSVDPFTPFMLKANSSGSDTNLFWSTAPGPLVFRSSPHYNMSQWRSLGFDHNSRIADPQFVSPLTGDFRLKASSPAFDLGFERLPIEKMTAPTPLCRGDACLAVILRDARAIKKFDLGPAPAKSDDLIVHISVEFRATRGNLSRTRNTVMVVTNPLLERTFRTPGGAIIPNPIHANVFRSLRALEADSSRYLAWFVYPELAIAEPEPGRWELHSSRFMTMLEDYMSATHAQNHTVLLDLTTQPCWLFTGPNGSAANCSYARNPDETNFLWKSETLKRGDLRDPSQLSDYYIWLYHYLTRGWFIDASGRNVSGGPAWSLVGHSVELFNEVVGEHGYSMSEYNQDYDHIIGHLNMEVFGGGPLMVNMRPSSQTIELSAACSSMEIVDPASVSWSAEDGVRVVGCKDRRVVLGAYGVGIAAMKPTPRELAVASKTDDQWPATLVGHINKTSTVNTPGPIFLCGWDSPVPGSDRARIQTIIDAAANTGLSRYPKTAVVVQLNSTVYRIDTPVVIRDYIALVGSGMNTTTIVMGHEWEGLRARLNSTRSVAGDTYCRQAIRNDNAPYPSRQQSFPWGNHDMRVADLSIDCGAPTNTHVGEGIMLALSYNFVIERVHVRGRAQPDQYYT